MYPGDPVVVLGEWESSRPSRGGGRSDSRREGTRGRRRGTVLADESGDDIRVLGALQLSVR